jgi:hypothetical protein
MNIALSFPGNSFPADLELFTIQSKVLQQSKIQGDIFEFCSFSSAFSYVAIRFTSFRISSVWQMHAYQRIMYRYADS